LQQGLSKKNEERSNIWSKVQGQTDNVWSKVQGLTRSKCHHDEEQDSRTTARQKQHSARAESKEI